MASVNKVIVLGNLGKDPETRYTADGAAITNITVATSFVTKDKNSGEKRETTEWHRIVLFNRLAEIAAEYLRKGRPVYIEGRLQTRKWQDKDTGADRYSTEIVAESMQLLGGREGGGGGAAGGGDFETPEPAPRQAPRAAAPQRAAPPARPAANIADMDDDIPF